MKSSWAILTILFQSFGNKNKKVPTKFFLFTKIFSTNQKTTLNVAIDFELVFSLVTVTNELNKHLNLDHQRLFPLRKVAFLFCFVKLR